MSITSEIRSKVEWKLNQIGNDRCKLLAYLVSLEKDKYYLRKELQDASIRHCKTIKQLNIQNTKL